MRIKITKLWALLPLLTIQVCSFSNLYAMEFSAYENEERTPLPLVGKITMDYLKATSHEEDKPITLSVSVAPLLGGCSVDILMELDEATMPELIDLTYVRQIIDSRGVFSAFLEELRRAKIDQATVKVCLYFDGLPSHREKINGFDVLELGK